MRPRLLASACPLSKARRLLPLQCLLRGTCPLRRWAHWSTMHTKAKPHPRPFLTMHFQGRTGLGNKASLDTLQSICSYQVLLIPPHLCMRSLYHCKVPLAPQPLRLPAHCDQPPTSGQPRSQDLTKAWRACSPALLRTTHGQPQAHRPAHS